MGTRADFWIGIGPHAQWVGSVGWDGYLWAEDPELPLTWAVTEEEFRSAVEAIAEEDRQTQDFGFTRPEQGWPWPWPDSSDTDFAYAFVDGEVEVFNFGGPKEGWPDMTSRMEVAKGHRSGVLMIQMGHTSDGRAVARIVEDES